MAAKKKGWRWGTRTRKSGVEKHLNGKRQDACKLNDFIDFSSLLCCRCLAFRLVAERARGKRDCLDRLENCYGAKERNTHSRGKEVRKFLLHQAFVIILRFSHARQGNRGSFRVWWGGKIMIIPFWGKKSVWEKKEFTLLFPLSFGTAVDVWISSLDSLSGKMMIFFYMRKGEKFCGEGFFCFHFVHTINHKEEKKFETKPLFFDNRRRIFSTDKAKREKNEQF